MRRENKRILAEEYDSNADAQGKTHNNSPHAEDGDVQECKASLACILP
jgi:hypothetical protein